MQIAVILLAWSTVIFASLWIAALFRANRIEREHRAAMEYAASRHHPRVFLRYWLERDLERIREFYPDFTKSLDDEAGA